MRILASLVSLICIGTAHAGDVLRVGPPSPTIVVSPVTYNDDIELRLGTGGTLSCEWSTSDANANEFVCSGPEGGGTDVPVYVFGDASCNALDIGLFNGLTNGTVAAMNDACTGGTYFSHNGTDGTMVTTTGDLSLTIAGGDLIADAQIKSSVASNTLLLKNTTNNASVQVSQIHGDRSAPADSDLAYMSFYLSSVEGNQTEFGRLQWKALDADEASNVDGQFIFSVQAAGNLSDELILGASSLAPFTDGGNALGTTSLAWSGLNLNTATAINWENSDVTLTHASNLLTMAGGDFILSDDLEFFFGTSSDWSIQYDETTNDALIINEGTAGALSIKGSNPTLFNAATSTAGNDIYLNTQNAATDTTGLTGGSWYLRAGDAGGSTNAVGGGFIFTLGNGSQTANDGAFAINTNSGANKFNINPANGGVSTITIGSSVSDTFVVYPALVTPNNQSEWSINIPVTGSDAATHTLKLNIDANDVFNAVATGDGAGGIGASTITIGRTGDTIRMIIPQSDVGATCTLGDWAYDTGGVTDELCYCQATNTWMCTTVLAGPTD